MRKRKKKWGTCGRDRVGQERLGLLRFEMNSED